VTLRFESSAHHFSLDVTDLLSNATEQDIQAYLNGLQKTKNRTSADLQQNVYQNRTQFIKISKEAEKLKGEIETLRGLMSELTGALGQANNSNLNGLKSPPTSSSGQTSSRRNAHRSSVANLETMWNVQLQTLWKSVERSQKFLPAIPGRHIVMETPHWVELDSATWKPRRPVHIVLLNDNLLVASKKRKRMDPNNPQTGPAPTKLVAEECWSLQEIDLIDLGANIGQGGAEGAMEERNIGTAVNVRVGNKSYTYRHDQRSEAAKNELLLTFRKTTEELRKSNKAETENDESPMDALNYYASRDLAPAKQTEIMDSIFSSREKPEVLIEVDGKQQNLRWVEGQIDDLDIDIALQRFETAVQKIERLRKLAKGFKGNSIAQDLIVMKVDERASRLAATLIRALVDTASFLDPTKEYTSWLSRLGFEDRAREAYLRARTESLVKHARQCVFEGDLPKYIFQVSFVYFTLVGNSASVYQACFPQLMMSACVKWAKEHLEQLNVTLVRQLSSVERGSSVWNECMDLVWRHEAPLKSIGLDFHEVIGKGLGGKAVAVTSPRSNGVVTSPSHQSSS
jgi:exocyst complex component 8